MAFPVLCAPSYAPQIATATTADHIIAAVEQLAARFGRDELHAMWAVVAASNECPPGFPRDDPGPWYWSCLSSLTRAATLATTDTELARHYVGCAERAAQWL